MNTILEYTLLAIVFTQASSYTLMSPKIYAPSVPTNGLGWSNLVQNPFRSCRGRYFNEPYFTPNVQNPEYILAQEPYSQPMDDIDYYANYMYYVPTANRPLSYYDQPLVDVTNDIQDYDEDSSSASDDEGSISELQRAWWLEKNVAPNEDTDYDRFNQVDDAYVSKAAKSTSKPKQKTKESRKIVPKTRYVGIDGFGRKKDKELVYGNFKTNPRKVEEHMVYGVPVNAQYDDANVKELKSLAKESADQESTNYGGDVNFADWTSGNAKRDTNSVKSTRTNENWSTKEKSTVPSSASSKMANPFSAYNEGGHINVQLPAFAEKWSDYEREEPSVFDTIKKLLALEDKIDQTNKINKRKNANSKFEKTKTTAKITTSKPLPDVDSHSTIKTMTSSTTKTSKNRRRSVPPVQKYDRNSIYTDEESLVNQLNGLRHRTS